MIIKLYQDNTVHAEGLDPDVDGSTTKTINSTHSAKAGNALVKAVADALPYKGAMEFVGPPVVTSFDSDTATINAGGRALTPDSDVSGFNQEVQTFFNTIYQFDNGYYVDQYRLKQANAPTPPDPTPEELAQRPKDLANLEFTNTVNAILSQYAQGEEKTWDVQKLEAEAWSKDNTAPTPLIDAILSESGEDKAEFVANVLGKSQAFTVAVGRALGVKRKKLAQIG